MPDTASLVLSDICGGYEGPDILRGISLTVPQGHIVTVVGPNGHGKSTLLKAISGLIRIRRGDITLSGRSVRFLAPHRIAAAGVVHVPQGDLLFPHMSVYENLMMGAYGERDPHQVGRRLEEVYALLPRLAERHRQIASSLSGGERRMAAIGRGLMAGGQILMLDEPSLGLAPLVIEQIYESIGQLRAQGRTILLVEENPARVADLCDDMHLLDEGRIVWSGPPHELMDREELLAVYLGG